MDISVIICTHNPRADFLQRTLDALEGQKLPKDRWELLLIDNASVGLLEGKWDLSWHPYGRHIREDELGLTPARLRGIREACGELLVFVDDDNLLISSYLEDVHRIAKRFPCLGCFGAGKLIPEFDVAPADEVRPYLGALALRDSTRAAWGNIPSSETTPWGAGLVCTSELAGRYLQFVHERPEGRALDRKGTSLSSAGDTLFSYIARANCMGTGTFPNLECVHLIGEGRVAPEYLLKLIEAQESSRILLEYLISGKQPELPCGFTYRDAVKALCSGRIGRLALACGHMVGMSKMNRFDRLVAAARVRGAASAQAAINQGLSA